MLKRKLGKSGLEISALGLGCRAIGGLFWRQDEPAWRNLEWDSLDNGEAIQAIHRASDPGVGFFDPVLLSMERLRTRSGRGCFPFWKTWPVKARSAFAHLFLLLELLTAILILSYRNKSLPEILISLRD